MGCSGSTPSSYRPSSPPARAVPTTSNEVALQEQKPQHSHGSLNDEYPNWKRNVPGDVCEFVEALGFLHPVSKQPTCRGYLNESHVRGERCPRPCLKPAMNAIKRLLSLAENEGNGGTYVYKKVLEEIPYLVCSPDHGRRAATDMVVAEICIAIGTYRVGKLNQPLPNIVILYDKVLSRKAREYCRMALEKTCRNAENHLAYHKQQSDAFQEAVDKGLIIEKTEGGVPIDRNGGKTGGPQTELPAATSSHPHANHAQLTAPGQSQGFPGTDPHGMEYSDVMQRTSELHIRRRPVTPTPANDSYAQPGYPQKALPQGQGMNGARYPYTR